MIRFFVVVVARLDYVTKYNFKTNLFIQSQELEEERSKLVYDVTMNKRRMKELEENLLWKLTSIQVRTFLFFFLVLVHSPFFSGTT